MAPLRAVTAQAWLTQPSISHQFSISLRPRHRLAHATACVWRSEDALQKSGLPVHHTGAGDLSTQVTCLYLLSHPAGLCLHSEVDGCYLSIQVIAATANRTSLASHTGYILVSLNNMPLNITYIYPKSPALRWRGILFQKQAW